MSDLHSFAYQVKQAYDNQDSQLFSQLITLEISSPTVLTLTQVLLRTSESQSEQVINSILEETSIALSETINNYLQLVRCLDDQDIFFVFDTFATFYGSLIALFNGADTFYQVPVVKTLSTSLVQLAFSVDKMGLQGKARKVNTAARLLSKMFNIMLADRSPIETSKRQGIFHITNLAFKVYFNLNSIRMCQTLISNIRTGGLDMDMFPIAQQVTYRYYLGRYSLYHGKLKEAQNHLLFAFEKCHGSQWHNKRIILHYLIPTRIILGHFPQYQLLEKYQLIEPFSNLIKAIRCGDMNGFLQHLETYFNYFYNHFTYLLLKEKGVVLVWRCLIKNMYHQKQSLGATAPVIEFNDCLKAFKLAANDYSIDDMECILVSLVSQGYVRGYLQHQKQRLVLSKVNAFPPISAVRLHTEKYNESLMEDHMVNAQPALPAEIEQFFQ